LAGCAWVMNYLPDVLKRYMCRTVLDYDSATGSYKPARTPPSRADRV